MRRRAAVPMLAILLGGCGDGIDLTDATPQQVTAAVNAVARQQPGRWRTMTELVAMDVGGRRDPGVAAMVRRETGRQRVDTGCLTAEQASVPGFGALRGGTCRFDRFALRDDRLDAALQCSRAGAVLTVTQQGRYTATGYDIRSTVRQKGPGGATSITMHLTGRRIGACWAERQEKKR